MFRSNWRLMGVVCLGVGLVVLAAGQPLDAAAPGRKSSAPLRYAWQEGQQFAYEVEITADRDSYVDTMKGVITYTAKSANADQLRVGYYGGLSKKQVNKPGQSSGSRFPGFRPPPFSAMRPPGLFGGTTFRGTSTSSNTITLSPQGEVLALEGDSQLPYLLGNLSLLVFEPLPEKPQPSWTVSNGVAITSENGRSGPPYFRPPGFPFGSNKPDKTKTGSESLSFRIQSDNGRLVTATRQYQLTAPKVDGESSQVSGKGVWTFNRELAIAESLDFTQQLTVRDGNTTVTVPVKVKYRRLSEPELAKHQAEKKKLLEEAQKRNKVAAEERAKKPLSSSERKKILADLRSAEFHKAIFALQKLESKSPNLLDQEIATAVGALVDHENRLVQMHAEKLSEKLQSSGHAAPGTQSARTWSDNTGKFKIEAEFVGLADGNVTLRRKKDGKEVSVPLIRLSEPDQKAANDLASQAAETSNPFEP